MERITVLYANKEGAHFDFDYYMKKHIPWVAGLFGRKIEVRRGISSAAGSQAPVICLATILTTSIDEFKTVFSKDGAAILADVANYTNIEPVVQFDEVLD